MPALAIVWGKEDSKHTFGASAFGVSGFGVTFPEEANNPLIGASFNPTINSNPINYPQAANGFGLIESDYLLLQIGFAWAYELSDKFSIGLQPTFNYGSLMLKPNPTASPTGAGYPNTENTSTTGFGGQVGLFFDSGNGFKAGASYKTEQSFSDLEFDNTYLDASTGTSTFKMNYPAIISVGLGYSAENFDFAADYRFVDYKNTDGFAASGWTQTASVAGFGWENMNIVSLGIQYKGLEKLPLRVGYTYSSNPITEELAFFSVSAPAVINNAFQIGLSFIASDKITLDAMFHHGTSGETKGVMMSPLAIAPSNPLGALPGTSVSYNMSTDLIMVGASYTFNK
jgi:long-chain fatty acid transport protein